VRRGACCFRRGRDAGDASAIARRRVRPGEDGTRGKRRRFARSWDAGDGAGDVDGKIGGIGGNDARGFGIHWFVCDVREVDGIRRNMTTETEDGARKSLGNMAEREFLVDLVRDRGRGRRERANWTILERSPRARGCPRAFVSARARRGRGRMDSSCAMVGTVD
jgi:hypothetical protein